MGCPWHALRDAARTACRETQCPCKSDFSMRLAQRIFYARAASWHVLPLGTRCLLAHAARRSTHGLPRDAAATLRDAAATPRDTAATPRDTAATPHCCFPARTRQSRERDTPGIAVRLIQAARAGHPRLSSSLGLHPDKQFRSGQQTRIESHRNRLDTATIVNGRPLGRTRRGPCLQVSGVPNCVG